MTNILTRTLCGVAATLLLAAGGAQAQSTAPTPPSDVSRQGGSLSRKLNATDGVIHPEGTVDPGMQKAPSETGTMPVVPPPGSPGGAPNVIPK